MARKKPLRWAQIRSFFSPPVLVTLLLLLSLLAFSITGFGEGLGIYRSLPLYLFFTLLLLVFQAAVSRLQPRRERLLLFISSIPAILYIGFITYFSQQLSFIQEPLTYIIINVTIVVVFIADAVRRFGDTLHTSSNNAALLTQERGPDEVRERIMSIAGALGADSAGLAILLGLLSRGVLFLQSATEPKNLLMTLNPLQNLPTAPIPEVGTSGVQSIPLPIIHGGHVYLIGQWELWKIDELLAFVGLALLLIALVVIGGLTPRRGKNAIGGYLMNLRTIFVNSLAQMRLSARRGLSPLIWLLPAFLIAVLAGEIALYYAMQPGKLPIAQLFSPFTFASLVHSHR